MENYKKEGKDMSKKILVIDDEDKILKMIEARLSSEGYDVVTASDGEEGLRKTKIEKPDLIILDIIMPIMDGTDKSQALRTDEVTKDIPIEFLTCLVNKGEAAGIDHRVAHDVILAKPFEAEELVATVKKIIG